MNSKTCHNTDMKEPAILYLLVGLPGAGKTTRARQLAVEAPALRLTPDEWMIPLFGRDDPAARDVLYASSEKLRSESRHQAAWHQASEISCRGDSANSEWKHLGGIK